MNITFDPQEFAKYSLPLPYPDAIIPKPNKHYAKLISGAYAGQGSELTAITQYTAHNFYTENYPAIHTAYRYISYVETIHLRLLGRLIREYGLRPVFASYETELYWKGNFPVYAYEIKEILLSDIQGEQEAIAHYKRLIMQIDNESVQDLFRRIILDEEQHVEILTGLYKTLK